MLGHDRREGRREEHQAFGRGGNATRYQLREKVLAIGYDSWVEDESGRRAFKVNGTALRVRQTLVLGDRRAPSCPRTATSSIDFEIEADGTTRCIDRLAPG